MVAFCPPWVLTLAMAVANVTDTSVNEIASIALNRIDDFFDPKHKIDIPDLTLFFGTFWLPTVHCNDGFITNVTVPKNLENVQYEKIGHIGYLEMDFKFQNLDFTYAQCGIKVFTSKIVTWKMTDVMAAMRFSFSTEQTQNCTLNLESLRIKHLSEVKLTPESNIFRVLGTKMIQITGRFFNRKMVQVLNENLTLAMLKIMPNICERIAQMSETFFED